ncbi:MAG: pyridoxamine 5'-phosphate oxidase [Pedobacter sp.]|nr:MAG: pyridoxamine 5'-phosphate oxidase [Pedobacter sp.]
MELSKEFIQNLRQEYKAARLNEEDVLAHPLSQFEKWFKEAIEAQLFEPNVMTLATADLNAKPHARIVLLKGFDVEGFTFFTNYLSHKGQQILNNPQACLVFFWADLERQVRIEGNIIKIDSIESDSYFNTRPRLSQLGAHASPQSNVIVSRDVLEDNLKHLSAQYDNLEIPRPIHWGGYKLIPNLIEFWQGRESRLHDRIVYEQVDGKWEISRLAP